MKKQTKLKIFVISIVFGIILSAIPAMTATTDDITVIVWLKDSGGTGIEGGVVQYYSSGWKSFGTTDSLGSVSMDLPLGSYKVQISYGGVSNSLTQDISVNPNYFFYTTPAEVWFTKNDGSTPISDAKVQYYASSWKTFGDGITGSDGKVKTELLPGNYKVELSYGGASNHQIQDISGEEPEYHFMTTPAKVLFTNSDGLIKISGAGVKYYASGWKTFGDGTTDANGEASMELLPGSYKVKLSYGGASNELTRDITAVEPEYHFKTTPAGVKFTKNDGTTPIAGAGVKYYASSWQKFGTGETDANGLASMELLPNTYQVQLSYGGSSNYLTRDINAEEPEYHFKTTLAGVEFMESDGLTPIPNAGVKYYAGGWKTFGDGKTDTNGEASVELLPGSYEVKISYLGASNYLTKDITAAEPEYQFQTILTKVLFTDYGENPISGGKVKYYSSGWKTFGTGTTDTNGETIEELLSNTYKVQLVFDGSADFLTQDIGVNPVYHFYADLGNNPPIADTGGPYTAFEGSEITFDASGSYDPENDALEYRWDFNNDGTWDADWSTDYTASYTWTDDYSGYIVVEVSDGQYTDIASASITVNNVAPTADFTNNGPMDEGSEVTVSFSNQVDPGTDTFTYSFGWEDDDVYNIVDQPSASATYTWDDNGVYTVRGRIADDDKGYTEYTTVVTINNVAPTITALTVEPDLVQIGSPIDLNADFNDPGVLDTHTVVVNWGDGSEDDSDNIVTEQDGSGTVKDSYIYSEAGVYTITIKVSDNDEGRYTEIFQYIVVYDPNGGFVTGGGWIYSPKGAYTENPNLVGKANFGFVSKYKKGQSTPTGNTEFQFKAGDLNFHSSNYDWLVISGNKAKYKGTGTINGKGNYGFMISAIDGDPKDNPDTFRIKIWDKDDDDALVYDNQYGSGDDADPATTLGGGQIVIHKAKK